MASELEFVQYVADQIQIDYAVRYRKMFGEYAIYANDKVVALVCDNRLFVKPTDAGKAYIGDFVEAPAYPGAKPSLLIEDGIEDAEWLSALIKITERVLPVPRPKSKAKTRAKLKKD